MGGFAHLNPADLTSSQLYDLLTFAIQPRPIAFVSTLSESGVANLAPFSFFMPGGANPPSLAVSVNLASGGRSKDTLRNIETNGEFVVNIVTPAMAEGMNSTSFAYPPDVSEWGRSGFTPVESIAVAPPRVSESPFQFECRVHQIVRHGDGSGAAVYVIGEVVQVHVAGDYWDGEKLVLAPFATLSRLGGARYLDSERMEMFELARPTAQDGS